jgi:acetyl esterase/lipase
MRAGCFLLIVVALGMGQKVWAGAEPYELDTLRNVPYLEGPEADPVLHMLDIHRPKGCQNYPVLFFVHGGGWVQGHKDHLGFYTLLGKTLARHGIGVVSPNYRLSPQVRHPEHMRDVARAFAWTQRNIGKYGGNPQMIFVGGHSAGGHLSALLATDDTYLKAEGMSLANIKGAIPISGVFILPDLRMFDVVFGKELLGRQQASPITHIGDNLPPFLILYGDNDLPTCDRAPAQAFFRALQDKKCTAHICEIAPRNHLSILWNAAARETDPTTQNILSFIMSQVIVERLTQDAPGAVDEMSQLVARFAGAVGGKGRK